MPTLEPRHRDEYPFAIQRAGPVAFRVFDQVEQALLDDGFTQEEVDGLLMINLDQILAEAKLIAQQEAEADARRAAHGANKQRQQRGQQLKKRGK